MSKTKWFVIRQNLNKTVFLGAFVFGVLQACVTVNVNFPESAVQKASDDFVGDLYRSKEQTKALPSSSKTSSPTPTPGKTTSISIESLFMSNAFAEVSFDLSSPKVTEIKNSMKSNIPDIIEQKKAGVLGETSDGHLTIKDPSKLKPLLKKKVEDLVKDDNLKRDSLYNEIANSKHVPVDGVRKSFSRSFQSNSPSGSWTQGDDGKWSQKP